MQNNETTQKKIAVDQVQRLTAQVNMGIPATAIISCILAMALLNVLPKANVLLWLAISLTISTLRIILQKKFQKIPLTVENVDHRRNYYLISLGVSGCIWGSLPIFLFPHSSMAHQVLIIFVLGGMVVGSVGIFASIMQVFYTFSIPTIVPLLLVLLSLRDRLHLAMGSMLIIFLFLMVMAARRLNQEIYNFLLRKYKNVELIESLEKEIMERQNAEKQLMFKNQQIETIVQTRTAELQQVNRKLRSEIEDRIVAEKALRESEEKYRELANSLPQMVFETDAGGNITFANRNTYEMLEYSKNDFENGLSVFEIIASGHQDNMRHLADSITEGKPLTGHDYMVVTKTGRSFPIEIHSTPIIQCGKSIGIRGIIIDLTEKKRVELEQKKLERQLQRANKMEVLGTMAGGVAHDLNNILSGIVSYPDLLLMQISPDSSLYEAIQIIQESGKKAAAIVQDLLTLTRRGLLVEEVLNLNDIICDYLNSPEHEKLLSFHQKVQVISSLEYNLLNIIGSHVHLTKTVMNLISNAAEAMPKGGVIELSTRSQYLDHPIKGYDEIKEGDYVVLTVADSGIGIVPSDIERIFEPFFTKKKLGRSGTGLGMAVVWGTVKDHNGYIDVNSFEGRGTQFSLYFPITRKQRYTTDHKEEISSYFGKGETVLLVDDVPEQRQIGSELLQQLGYEVAVVASGEEAVEYLRVQKVDLLVLDMIMDPGMDGLDTYKQIKQLHPKQKAVIASGYSETDRVKETIELGAGPYIKKPYTWVKLGQAVRTALDHWAASAK